MGLQHTISWRPPSPEISDRWHPFTNWLPSAPSLTLPPPKKPKQRLEGLNRLEATSHHKLVTDGASPKMAPTYTVWLTSNHHELGQPTWAGSPPGSTCSQGEGEYTCLAVSHGIPNEISWNFMLYTITQLLVQPL